MVKDRRTDRSEALAKYMRYAEPRAGARGGFRFGTPHACMLLAYLAYGKLG